MIVTALPPTSPLTKDLVELARTSWDPPELVAYLTMRGDVVEETPVGEDFYVTAFSGAGDDLQVYGFDRIGAREPTRWGLWVPFCWLDSDNGQSGEGSGELFGWTEAAGGSGAHDTAWEQICAAVAAELGPAQVSTNNEVRADGTTQRIATWQVGATALMVVQTTDCFFTQHDLEMCAVRLCRLDAEAGLPGPEVLRNWVGCRSRTGQ